MTDKNSDKTPKKFHVIRTSKLIEELEQDLNVEILKRKNPRDKGGDIIFLDEHRK